MKKIKKILEDIRGMFSKDQVEETVQRSVEDTVGSKLEKAIVNSDIDAIIALIEQGVDVNMLLFRTESEFIDGHFYEEWTVDVRPLDFASSDAVKKLLIAHGAKTQKQIQAEKEVSRAKNQRLTAKNWKKRRERKRGFVKKKSTPILRVRSENLKKCSEFSGHFFVL